MCVTILKPDIVIIDKQVKTIHLYEFTCPIAQNIEKRHLEKANKYAQFINEMSGYKCTLTCFEVSSLGYLTPENNARLKSLHSFLKPGIKLPSFKHNVSNLALNSSFHIFHCRSEQTFIQPPYLQPPIHHED